MKHKNMVELYTTNPDDPNDPKGVIDYFQRVIDQMPNRVYWLNSKNVTMGCNRNILSLFGLKRIEDFIGLTYPEMAKLANWQEGQEKSFQNDDIEVIKTGKPKLNVEEPVVYDNGKPQYYISSRVPLTDAQGEIIGVIGISTDITYQKKLEQQLIDSKANEARFKTLSAVGGMIAHELRTPLATIGNTGQSIQNLLPQLVEGYRKAIAANLINKPLRADLLEAIEESTDNINQSVAYAQATITTILAGFHYSNTDQVAESLSNFSLKNCIEKALKKYPMDTDQRKLIDIDGVEPIVISGDEQILAHVIHNLLKNSLYSIASSGKGEVTIKNFSNKDNIELIFLDTGGGIKSDQMAYIFEPFYTTKKETAKSVGLGLYFCKMALQKIGATISCDSSWGEYTQFTISLKRTD